MASDVITYRLGSNAARRIMRAMRNEVERLRAHAVQFNGQETARFAAREAELLSLDLGDMVKAFLPGGEAAAAAAAGMTCSTCGGTRFADVLPFGTVEPCPPPPDGCGGTGKREVGP